MTEPQPSAKREGSPLEDLQTTLTAPTIAHLEEVTPTVSTAFLVQIWVKRPLRGVKRPTRRARKWSTRGKKTPSQGKKMVNVG